MVWAGIAPSPGHRLPGYTATLPSRADTRWQNDRQPYAAVVGGDAPTRSMVRFLLENEGCKVVELRDLGASTSAFTEARPDILVLIDGQHQGNVLASLIQARRLGYHAPAILLTRGIGRELRRQAIAAGAREILSLPVPPEELRRRLQDVIGTETGVLHNKERPATIRAGGLILDALQVASADGAWQAALTRQEAAVLHALMQRPGHIVRHAEIVGAVWSERSQQGSNAVAVIVRRLRCKLARPEFEHAYIRTVPRQGYLFEARQSVRSTITVDTTAPVVLVIDDDEAVRRSVVAVLEAAGYQAVAGTGREAPILARQTQPGAIILDINMPGMNGIEVFHHLRSNPRTTAIPVIAFSAGYNLRLNAAQLPVDDYLPKPYDVDELLLRVQKWAGPSPQEQPQPLETARGAC